VCLLSFKKKCQQFSEGFSGKWVGYEVLKLWTAVNEVTQLEIVTVAKNYQRNLSCEGERSGESFFSGCWPQKHAPRQIIVSTYINNY